LKDETEISGSQTVRIRRRIFGEVGGNSMAVWIEAMVCVEFFSIESFVVVPRKRAEW
jgi:hypothetical protein